MFLEEEHIGVGLIVAAMASFGAVSMLKIDYALGRIIHSLIVLVAAILFLRNLNHRVRTGNKTQAAILATMFSLAAFFKFFPLFGDVQEHAALTAMYVIAVCATFITDKQLQDFSAEANSVGSWFKKKSK